MRPCAFFMRSLSFPPSPLVSSSALHHVGPSRGPPPGNSSFLAHLYIPSFSWPCQSAAPFWDFISNSKKGDISLRLQ